MEEEKKTVDFQFEVAFVDPSSSQQSDLDEADLDKLVLDSKPENTKKCTSWGISKFNSWMEKRNIVVDLKTVEAEILNNILRKFYAEVRTVKNEVLTPSSMTGIRAAIYRTILSPPYSRNMNILADREFSTAQAMSIEGNRTSISNRINRN